MSAFLITLSDYKDTCAFIDFPFFFLVPNGRRLWWLARRLCSSPGLPKLINSLCGSACVDPSYESHTFSTVKAITTHWKFRSSSPPPSEEEAYIFHPHTEQRGKASSFTLGGGICDPAGWHRSYRFGLLPAVCVGACVLHILSPSSSCRYMDCYIILPYLFPMYKCRLLGYKNRLVVSIGSMALWIRKSSRGEEEKKNIHSLFVMRILYHTEPPFL